MKAVLYQCGLQRISSYGFALLKYMLQYKAKGITSE